jgi:hypothetical protein
MNPELLGLIEPHRGKIFPDPTSSIKNYIGTGPFSSRNELKVVLSDVVTYRHKLL